MFPVCGIKGPIMEINYENVKFQNRLVVVTLAPLLQFYVGVVPRLYTQVK